MIIRSDATHLRLKKTATAGYLMPWIVASRGLVMLLLYITIPVPCNSYYAKDIPVRIANDETARIGPPTPFPNRSHVVNHTANATAITIVYLFDPEKEWMSPYIALIINLTSGNPFQLEDYSIVANMTEKPASMTSLSFNFDGLTPYRRYLVFLTFTNEEGQSMVRFSPDIYTTAVAPPKLDLNKSTLRYHTFANNATFEILIKTRDCSGPNTTLAGVLQADDGTIVHGKEWFHGWRECSHNTTSARFDFINLLPLRRYGAIFWITNSGNLTSGNSTMYIWTKALGPTWNLQASTAAESQTTPFTSSCVYDFFNRIWFNFHEDWFVSPVNLSIASYEVVLAETDKYDTMGEEELFNISADTTWLDQVGKSAPFRVTADGWNPFILQNSSDDQLRNHCCYLQNGTKCGCERWASRCKDPEDTPTTNVLTVVIGDTANNCSGLPNSSLCVGILSAGTNYSIYIRALSDKSDEYNLNPSKAVVFTFIVSGPSDSKGGIIAGIIIGVVAAIAVVILVVYVIRSDYRKQLQSRLVASRSTNRVSPASSNQVSQTSSSFSKAEFGLKASRPTVLPMPLPAENTVIKMDLFRPVRIKNLSQNVAEMSCDGEFLFQEEHEIIDENSPPLPFEHDPLVARHDCNRCKNRFTNILPFDDNRVKLMSNSSVDDYINASFIKGLHRSTEYIAAQGPLGDKEVDNSLLSGRLKVNTVNDFWLMIWEKKVEVVVMLTRVIEKSRVKCAPYWPEDVNDTETYGTISVTLLSELQSSAYCIRILEVEKDEESRRVRHYNFLNWADFDAPTDPSEVLEFIQEIRSSIPTTSTAPVLAHCSAGVGRSGTYIAIDSLLQHIQHSDSVDIFSFVMELRKQRVQMVQSPKQYALIYRALALAVSRRLEEIRERQEDGLQSPNLIITTASVHSDGSLPTSYQPNQQSTEFDQAQDEEDSGNDRIGRVSRKISQMITAL